MKEVRVILSTEAEEVYKKLNSESETNKQSSMILKAINHKIELIKANIHYGNPIAKNLIQKNIKRNILYQTYSELNFLHFGECFTL